MPNRGEAASYYDGANPYHAQGGEPVNGYTGPPPQQYPDGEKPMFEQAFKVEKPKWNDLWAGILVRFGG